VRFGLIFTSERSNALASGQTLRSGKMINLRVNRACEEPVIANEGMPKPAKDS
jgi:hypothetical protein